MRLQSAATVASSLNLGSGGLEPLAQGIARSGSDVIFFNVDLAQVVTPDEAEKLECRFFLHYAEGSLMPPLIVQLILTML